jgi:SAM-dependent methyltransferase
MNLGHWDGPGPNAPTSYGDAQQRMHDEIAKLASITASTDVLDVGCGFGGSLRRLASQGLGGSLTGVERNAAVMEAAGRLFEPPDGVPIRWLRADACELPFETGAFDVVLSVEAMMHFRSRRRFLAEAARVLRPGGAVAVSDLLIAPDVTAVGHSSPAKVAMALDDGFGPWPEPDATVESVIEHAGEVGLTCTVARDVTRNTQPSAFELPERAEWHGAQAFDQTAPVKLFTALRQHGLISVVYFRFDRPARPPLGRGSR